MKRKNEKFLMNSR